MKTKLLLFVVTAIVLFTTFIFSVVKSKKDSQEFITHWSTTLAGTVVKIESIESNSGIIYLNLDTIIGSKYDVDDYEGGPFYLLTSDDKAKILEGGMSTIQEQDLVIIEETGNFIVLREGKPVIKKKIYYSDFAPFWEKVNENSVKSHWNW